MKSHLREAIDNFAATLPPDSALRKFIESRDVNSLVNAFDEADARAIRKQALYRRLSRVALVGTFLSAVIAALGLMPLGGLLSGRPAQVLTVLQATCFLVSFLAGVWVAWARPAVAWRRARAKAEFNRAEVFSKIINSDAGDISGLPQRLACVLEAHVDGQLAFLRKRGAEFERQATARSRVRWAAYTLWGIAGLITLAAAIKGFEELGIPVWEPLVTAAHFLLVPDSGRWQLGVSTLASSILTFTSAQAQLDESDRHAWSYALTADSIDKIMLRRSYVVSAAEAGDSQTVKAFCWELQEALSKEHRGWTYGFPA